MKVGVVREIMEYERRVAIGPDSVGKLVAGGYEVEVERGAGEEARFSDSEFEEAGAVMVDGPEAVYRQADIVAKVQRPIRNEHLGVHEAEMMREGQVLVSLLQPGEDPELLLLLARRKITAFSMNLMPRISRAQSMDVLSSQATVAGYKAVLIAAASHGKFFPMLTTAAGTLAPARVLVLGAGVAGLMAIATARRLGAVVEAYDIRPAVKEEVESLGAKFVEVDLGTEETQDEQGYAKEISDEAKKREKEIVAEHVAASDVVITTAAIPGKKAPLLIPETLVKAMKPGSVIVDIAAESGGNCELSMPGEEVVKYGVTIHGPIKLASTMPIHASQMYARNIITFLGQIVKENRLELDFENEVIRDTCVTHEGKVLNEQAAQLIESK
jgi:NAD(P) transhydrogenase subunit alpha